MSTPDLDAALEGIKASLAKKIPKRLVTRSLKDPASLSRDQLLAGVVCVVNEGGGEFANYLGREGDLGLLQVALVGFVAVPEKSETSEIERVELELLRDLLDWTADQGEIRACDMALPTEFTQSKQLEHPNGWVLLKLDVRP